MPITRRLAIQVTHAGFLTTTEYRNRLGYWMTLSTTFTEAFPWHIVHRVADRADYQILVRA